MNLKTIAATMAMTLLVSSAALASADDSTTAPVQTMPLRTLTMHRSVEGEARSWNADDTGEVAISIVPADFRALAENLGLDISGLSDEEIEAAVQEHLQARHEALMALPFEERELKLLQEAAEEAGIDHSGMDAEELREALNAAGINIAFFEGGHAMTTQAFALRGSFAAFDATELAAEYDIDTADMTDEEIQAAVEAKMEEERQALQDMSEEERARHMLEKMAKRHGIETAGLSDEEIQAALEEKGIHFLFTHEAGADIEGVVAYSLTIAEGENLGFSATTRTLPALPLRSE